MTAKLGWFVVLRSFLILEKRRRSFRLTGEVSKVGRERDSTKSKALDKIIKTDSIHMSVLFVCPLIGERVTLHSLSKSTCLFVSIMGYSFQCEHKIFSTNLKRSI